MKFLFDGIEYNIPDSWLERAITVRKVLGMSPNEAIESAIEQWIRSHQAYRNNAKVVEFPA